MVTETEMIKPKKRSHKTKTREYFWLKYHFYHLEKSERIKDDVVNVDPYNSYFSDVCNYVDY